jgi:hypothetical protein
MNAKKIILVSFLVLALFGIFASPAFAVWVNCNVVKVGAGGAYVLIQLRACDGSFGNRWYYLPTGSEKLMAATALTAMTSGWQVRVNINPNVDEYSMVTNMYLSKTAECP